MSDLMVQGNGDEVIVSDHEERPGWYVTVNEGLDVFASGPGERRTNGEDGGEEWRCTTCHLPLRAPDETGEDEFVSEKDGATCPDADADAEDRRHAPEPIPLSWANSAHITFDDADDAIHVSISVGDPRGRFVFTVRRWEEHVDGEPTGRHVLLMHTPYPGESMPHMSLTEIRPGTYQVGEH